jgi:hypothetical protein
MPCRSSDPDNDEEEDIKEAIFRSCSEIDNRTRGCRSQDGVFKEKIICPGPMKPYRFKDSLKLNRDREVRRWRKNFNRTGKSTRWL